jgi:hypothetical protein
MNCPLLVLPRMSLQKIAYISDDSYTLGEGIRFSRIDIQMDFSKPTGIPGDYEGSEELKAAVAEVKAKFETFKTATTPEDKETAATAALAAVTKMEKIINAIPRHGGRRRKTRGRKGRRGTRR